MTSPRDKSLLPTGLRDVLPPEADHAADVVARLLAGFAAHGYEQVKPPLIEFEDSLLDGAGAAMSRDTFRLMDPVSQRMMGVRADITLQVARIAATRLRNVPRPLRLTYAGDVLRVRGTQLRPERQFTQIGAELIGAATAAADVEAVLMAVEALRDLGVTGLTVDLSTPTLVGTACAALDIGSEAEAALRAALDRRDAAAVAEAVGNEAAGAAATFSALLAAAGPARRALEALAGIDLPAEAAAERGRLAEVSEELLAALPDVQLTIDPVEHRGFEYHTGVSFTILKSGVRGDLGSGGRYLAGSGFDGRPTEPATGFTLYLDTILRALPPPAPPKRLYLPHGTSREEAARLRREGWIGTAALERDGGAKAKVLAEARRLNCSHALIGGKPVPVDGA